MEITFIQTRWFSLSFFEYSSLYRKFKWPGYKTKNTEFRIFVPECGILLSSSEKLLHYICTMHENKNLPILRGRNANEKFIPCLSALARHTPRVSSHLLHLVPFVLGLEISRSSDAVFYTHAFRMLALSTVGSRIHGISRTPRWTELKPAEPIGPNSVGYYAYRMFNLLRILFSFGVY